MGDLEEVGSVFPAWLGHIFLGLGIQGLVVLIALLFPISFQTSAWLGAFLSMGFFWGREKMEFEKTLQRADNATSDAAYWYRGWCPLEWTWSSFFEWLAPTLVCCALAFFSPQILFLWHHIFG